MAMETGCTTAGASGLGQGIGPGEAIQQAGQPKKPLLPLWAALQLVGDPKDQQDKAGKINRSIVLKHIEKGTTVYLAITTD